LGQIVGLNSDVDDVGWVSKLMDDMIAAYNIDTDRIYSTGFSMGSFLSHRLACELNDRVAAIASVAGAIGINLDCQPGRAVPMCHLHGTADNTIGYTGNLYGTDAQETVDFWRDNNNCDVTPNSTDISTVTHYTYNNCDEDVEFYSAEGVGHEWISSPVNYSAAIWEFLSRHSLDNLTAASDLDQYLRAPIKLYPNPVTEQSNLVIDIEHKHQLLLEIVDVAGVIVQSHIVEAQPGTNQFQMSTIDLAKGFYLLSVEIEGSLATVPFVK